MKLPLTKTACRVLLQFVEYGKKQKSEDVFIQALCNESFQTIERKALQSLKRKSERGSMEISYAEALVLRTMHSLFVDEYGPCYESTVVLNSCIEPIRKDLEHTEALRRVNHITPSVKSIEHAT